MQLLLLGCLSVTVSLNVLNLYVVFGVLEYCVKASVLNVVP